MAKKRNIIVGQSGGPTSVINSSLAGVYKNAIERGFNKVYGMLHGIQGLRDEQYVDLSTQIQDVYKRQTIICERDSHKGIIIGKQGSMLKKIGSNARYELERMLEAKVNLKLWVKVKKDWRDSDFLMKNFGYDKKEI